MEGKGRITSEGVKRVACSWKYPRRGRECGAGDEEKRRNGAGREKIRRAGARLLQRSPATDACVPPGVDCLEHHWARGRRFGCVPLR